MQWLSGSMWTGAYHLNFKKLAKIKNAYWIDDDKLLKLPLGRGTERENHSPTSPVYVLLHAEIKVSIIVGFNPMTERYFEIQVQEQKYLYF